MVVARGGWPTSYKTSYPGFFGLTSNRRLRTLLLNRDCRSTNRETALNLRKPCLPIGAQGNAPRAHVAEVSMPTQTRSYLSG